MGDGYGHKNISNSIQKINGQISKRCLIINILIKSNMSGLGNPLGPFLICCGSGSEPKLYWQVDNNEILCTTETTKASKFHVYIKQGSKQFHIVHPESMKTVTVQRKNIFDRKTKPLKLVQIPTP